MNGISLARDEFSSKIAPKCLIGRPSIDHLYPMIFARRYVRKRQKTEQCDFVGMIFRFILDEYKNRFGSVHCKKSCKFTVKSISNQGASIPLGTLSESCLPVLVGGPNLLPLAYQTRALTKVLGGSTCNSIND